MRVIKFRLFDTYHKKMYGDLHEGIQWRASLDKDGTLNVEYGCVVMQYTGLKDQNGTEIYEGDLVAEVDNKKELKEWGKPLTVVFDEFITDEDSWGCRDRTVGFMLKYNDCEGTTGIYSSGDGYGFASDKLLIVGNIYETPHLLNSDKNAHGSVATAD